MANTNQLDAVAAESVPDSGKMPPAELAELLRQAERRAGMRRIASALAHAVGTPLNVIAGRAALISQASGEARSEHAANNAAVIERQVESLVARIQHMLKWLRAEPVTRESCSPVTVMETAASVYAALAETRGITIHTQPAEIPATTLPRSAALLVLVDLISLGLSTVPRGGTIELDVRHEHAEPPASERGRASAGKAIRFRVNLVETRIHDETFASPQEPWTLPEHVNIDHAQLISVCFGVMREHSGWIEVDQSSGSGTAIVANWPNS
jgi:two-component system, NtrC family, sensor kinase